MINKSFENLQQQLEFYKGYQAAYWETIHPFLHFQRYRRNHLISTAQFDMLFIHSGILCLHDGSNDDIVHFMSSPELVPDTYLDGNYYYQFLEDATLLYLPKHQLGEIGRRLPAAFSLYHDILKGWLNGIAARQQLLLLPKHKRKQAFKQAFPGLPGRIPNMVIANYLAMSPEYFSRTGW